MLAEPEAAGWPKPAGLCPNASLPKPEVGLVPNAVDPNAVFGAVGDCPKVGAALVVMAVEGVDEAEVVATVEKLTV